MKVKIIFFIFISCVFLNAQELNNEKIIKEHLKTNIKNYLSPSISNKLLNNYYKGFDYQLFWFEDNTPKDISKQLLSKIDNDEVIKPVQEKLFPKLFDITKEINKVSLDSSLDTIIDLDLQLTDLYHNYMKLLTNGYINWEDFENELLFFKEDKKIDISWQKYRKFISYRKLLYAINKDNDFSLIQKEVENNFFDVTELSKKIKYFEEVKSYGGFTKIRNITTLLKKGDKNKKISQIRVRLVQSLDLNDPYCYLDNRFCSDFFDDELKKGVEKFQKRHSLDIDGIVGRNTINALNTPVEKKIEKIRVNLERIRLLPSNFGEKFIFVNIPEFKLRVFDKDKEEFQTAVIVGEKQNPTPVFSHRLSEVVLNPYWRIPQSIVKKELIAKLVENPNYLEEENIKVFENWDIDSMQYDVSAVDWSMYLENDLIGDDKQAPMRFIQFPNEKNPLGKIKFLFPNRYSVYLHDTPQKYLFKNNYRAYSHGCIRVDKPNDLLISLLKNEKEYEGLNYEQLFSLDEKIDLELMDKVPVHIVYLTTWLDENKDIYFAEDIYGFDEIQANILYNPNYERKILEPKTLSASAQ